MNYIAVRGKGNPNEENGEYKNSVRRRTIMPKEVNAQDTTRAAAYELWMKAPNPMVTFFKTFDVTNLIRVSRRRKLKFNMLLDYCIGRAAIKIKEFYTLPVGDKLIQYDTILKESI